MSHRRSPSPQQRRRFDLGARITLSLLVAALAAGPLMAAQAVCSSGLGNYNTTQKGQHVAGKTYWVYSGTGTNLLDPYIGSFDHATGEVVTRKIADAPSDMVSKKDDHGNPVMLIDTSGYIHVVFGGHGKHRGEQRYYRSLRPQDITAFEAMNNVPRDGTYPNLMTLPGGGIMLFYRGPNNHRDGWYMVTSANGGDSWSAAVEVIAGGKKRTDGKYFESTYYDSWYGPDIVYEGKDGSVHFTMAYHACADDYSHQHHQLRRVSLFHFMRSASGRWQTMDGRALSLPVTREVMEQYGTVFESTDKLGDDIDRVSALDLTVDDAGYPHLLFQVRGHGLKMVRWTGSAWSPVRSLPTSARGFLRISGGVIEVYAGRRYRSTDGGKTWTDSGAVFTTNNAGVYPIFHSDDDVRCIVVDGDDPGTSRRMYLWGENGYVTPGVAVDPAPGPDPDPAPGPDPVPSDDAVIADTWKDDHVPMNVIDGDRATRWSAEGSGRWLRWDLGSDQTVGSVLVSWFRGDQRRSRFALELSVDGSNWRRIFDGESSGQTLLAEAYPGDGGSARYVRLIGYGNSDNAWNSVTELAIEAGSTSGWKALPLHADTYARDGAYQDDSFGQEAALIIKRSTTGYTRETYLRFDASQALVAGEVELALRVVGRGSDAGSTSFVIELMKPPATPWQEDSLSWKQRPTTVLQVGASFTCPAQVGEELVIEVSDLLQAAADAGILDRTTLRIRSTQSGGQRYVAFESDEAAGGSGPQLRWRALVSNG